MEKVMAISFQPSPEQQFELIRALRGLVVELLGDDHAAEDVLQNVWITSQSKKPREGTSYWAWLRGVARIEVLRHRRSERRRIVHEIAASRAEEIPDATTDEASERIATASAVLEELRELPEEDARILWIHYFEGRSTVDIAKREELTQEGIRSRLFRARGRLRARLERRFGRGSAWREAIVPLTVKPGELLVQDANTADHCIPKAADGTAGIKIARLGFGLANLMSLIAIVLLFWVEPKPRSESVAKLEYSSDSTRRREVEHHLDARSNIIRNEAASMGSRMEETALDTRPPLVVIRGRCIGLEDGMAIAGAKIDLRGRRFDAPETVTGRTQVIAESEVVMSGIDGRFDLCIEARMTSTVDLEISAMGRVKRSGHWSDTSSGKLIELGDVALARGFSIRGAIRSEKGVPVEGALAIVRFNTARLDDSTDIEDAAYERSGEGGAFCFNGVPCGTWPIEVRGPEWLLVAPSVVAAELETERGDIAINVHSAPSISGVVLDTHGAPVAGVGLQEVIDGNRRRILGQTTRSDGSFTIFSGRLNAPPVRLDVVGVDQRNTAEQSKADLIEWGTRDVRVVVDCGGGIEVDVVEEVSGKPVERYAIFCRRERFHLPENRWRFGGRHESGRAKIDRLSSGRYFVAVKAEDSSFEQSAIHVVDVPEGAVASQKILLSRMRSIEAVVADADGSPIRDASIEVIRLAGEPLGLATRVVGVDFENVPSISLEHRAATLLSSARTGLDGRARLRVSRDRGQQALRVTHPRFVGRVVQMHTDNLEEVMRIDLNRFGTMVGRADSAGYDWERLVVDLIRSDGGEGRRYSSRLRRVDSHLSFKFESLEPGMYEMRFALRLPGIALATDQGAELGEFLISSRRVSVRSGVVEEVFVSAEGCSPARLSGKVLLDGLPPTRTRLILERRGGARLEPAFPDDYGLYHLAGIPPGDYTALLEFDSLGGGQRLLLPSEMGLVAGAGASLTGDLEFVRRQLIVRIMDSEGVKPLPEARVHLQADSAISLSGTTDNEGQIVFEAVPRGSVQISCWPRSVGDGPASIVEKVEILRGERKARVVLRDVSGPRD